MEEMHGTRHVGRGAELPCSLESSFSPRLHMSTPGVYLEQGGCGAGGGTLEAEAQVGGGTTSGFWDSWGKKAEGLG